MAKKVKRIVIIFVLMTVVSCKKDEVTEYHTMEEEFYELVEGSYDLRVATTDPPIDLNQDGVAHTDLYKEVIYCDGITLNLNSYSCGFRHKSTYSQVSLDIPTSDYTGSGAGISACLSNTNLFYDFKVNSENQEVMLVQCDYCDDFAATFHAEILELDWENDRAYFTLRKRFRLSPDETKWVMLYLEYEKVLEEY